MSAPSSDQLRQQAAQLKREALDAIRRLMQCAHLTAVDLAATDATVHLSSDEHDPNRLVLLRCHAQSQWLAADVRLEGEAEQWDEEELMTHLRIEQLLDLLDVVQRKAAPQLQSAVDVNAQEQSTSDGITIRIQPFGGDRVRNLQAIAEAIQQFTPNEGTVPVTLEVRQARSLWGWAEQLRIIAAALAAGSPPR